MIYSDTEPKKNDKELPVDKKTDKSKNLNLLNSFFGTINNYKKKRSELLAKKRIEKKRIRFEKSKTDKEIILAEQRKTEKDNQEVEKIKKDKKKLKELKKLKKISEKRRGKEEKKLAKQKIQDEKLLRKIKDEKLEKKKEDEKLRLALQKNIEKEKQQTQEKTDKEKLAILEKEEEKKEDEEKEKKLLVLKEKERKIEEKRRSEKAAEKRKKAIYSRKRKKEKKKKRNEMFTNLNSLVKNLTRSGQEKFLFISGKVLNLLLILIIVCGFFYTSFTFIILKFDIDNKIVRYFSNYIFVPAFISKDGAVEYYNYQNHIRQIQNESEIDTSQADIDAKLIFTSEFIFNNLLKSHKLPSYKYNQIDESIKNEISKKLLTDTEINQVSLSRIKKVKELIKDNDDFVQISSKFGDKTGSLIINDDNKNEFSYYDTVSQMNEGEISNIILTNDGYYIFRLFAKNDLFIELNYVYINGITLDEYIKTEIEGYKLWSFVD